MKKLITFILFIFVLLPARAVCDISGNQKEADEMFRTLSSAKGAEDSIRILYDVYDLSHRANRKDVGYQILGVAERSGNREVVVDILNRLASRVEDTEALGRLMEYSTFLPNDSARRGVELMILMEKAKAEANASSPTERAEKILEYAQINMLNKTDIYEEILDLYRMIVYLGLSSQGSFYLEYLTRLQDLVEQLPEDDFAIKNLVYTTASIYYTRRQDPQKALEVSRKLLHQVDLLKQKYAGQRKYQTFDYFYYMVYRRMIENYPGLSQEEVQRIYDECVRLAEQNEEVEEIFDNQGLLKSFYNMAMHNYKEAIPYINLALSQDSLSLFRRQELLGMLVEALDSVGDRNGGYEAMRKYINAQKAYMQQRMVNTNQELELRRKVTRMSLEDRIEYENTVRDNVRMRKISITLVYVLTVVLLLIAGSYLKMRQKVKELSKSNRNLHTNLQHVFDDGTPAGSHDPRLKRGSMKG